MRFRQLTTIILISAVFLLLSCAPNGITRVDTFAVRVTDDESDIGIKIPTAPGFSVEKTTVSGESVIDYSNFHNGYIMMKNNGSERKLKGYIKTPDGIFYQYNLNADDNFIVCPLQAGSGLYTVQIMEQTVSSLYRSIARVDINVSLKDDTLPFLYPNYKVNYTEQSLCIKKANELTEGLENDLQKIEAIYDFVINNIEYDEEKADEVQPGYVPAPDATLLKGSGICSDYAALIAAMLRSQGIPTKFVEGYAPGDIRHAWNLVYTKDTGVVATKIEFDGSWTMIDSTFGAMLGDLVGDYIGDGSTFEEDLFY